MVTSDKKPLDLLVYWIKERHNIYLKRKIGLPKPWTEDRVLRSFFFTNPYRENDKVTAWLRENVRGPLKDDAAVVMAVITFRWFNYIPTGEVLMKPRTDRRNKTKALNEIDGLKSSLLVKWNCQEVVQTLSSIRDGGNQVFTGAFNISNSGSSKPKIERVCEDYLDPVWNVSEELVDDIKMGVYEGKLTLEELHDRLSEFPGMGGSGFMAGQVIADLKHTWVLRNAPDRDSWCTMGPGGKRGLNRILGRDLTAPLPKDWQQQMEQLRSSVNSRLFKRPILDAQDLQHSLCEFDKYCRALSGEGHMKRRYEG